MIHICCNLACAYIIFLAGASQTQSDSACTAVVFLLHVFLLASWCWMSVYSYDVYVSLIKVKQNGNSYALMVKAKQIRNISVFLIKVKQKRVIDIYL